MSIEDRITGILIDHHPLFTPGNPECYCREDFHDGDGFVEDRWAAHVARVLVTELRLHEQRGSFNANGYHGDGPNYPVIKRRYVTPWENT